MDEDKRKYMSAAARHMLLDAKCASKITADEAFGISIDMIQYTT